MVTTHLTSRLRRRALAWTVAATTAVAAASAWACPGPGGDAGAWPRMGPIGAIAHADGAQLELWLQRFGERLQLQPAQRDQIRRLVQSAAADLKPLREQGQQLRDERQRLWRQATLDEAAIAALRQREMAWHAQWRERVDQVMLDIARVLTPEQRQQLATRLAERPAHHGHHGDKRPRHRQGDAPPPPPPQ
jgi:Spy/CpxP family protein refolding chaperone